MMGRTIRRATFMTTLVLTIGIAGGADASGPDPILGGKSFGQNQALTFAWRSGATPAATIATAIKAAAADATATRASRAATIAYAAAGSNLIGYGLGATCGVNGLACFTRDAPTGFTMWVREQGHVFDWGTLKWCQAYTSPPNVCYDAETIALDEFGHVEGLDHHVNAADGSDYEDAVVQTFSRTKPLAGWDMHGFGVCDVATLQRLYDMTTWSAKYSTCGRLDTTLTILAPSTLAYGGTAVVVATLKIADDPAYGRLGANPVSARTVTLQARPAGTTAWSSVAGMTVGANAGTYAWTLRLTTDTQLRAVFAAPSDEGLGGSTSGTVTVDVGACRIPPCPLSAGGD